MATRQTGKRQTQAADRRTVERFHRIAKREETLNRHADALIRQRIRQIERDGTPDERRRLAAIRAEDEKVRRHKQNWAVLDAQMRELRRHRTPTYGDIRAVLSRYGTPAKKGYTR